mmetsp:Transcript_40982/g.41858  ORF Transcript_40982/g.41858 Transcript_40982/m.41858 type:complete len:334 (+) Transcript_40982:117-1118(+)
MPVSQAMQRKKEWGDDDDEEEYETPVDERTGVKQRVRVTFNAKGQKVRTTTTIRVFEKKIRIPKRVMERRNLPKFGEASDGDVNVTIVSREFVSIEHPDDVLGDTDDDPALGGTLQNFILKQQERAFEREMDLDGMLNDTDYDDALTRFRQAKEEPAQEEDSSKTGTSKYVPPSARGGAAGFPSDGRGGRASGLDNAFKNSSDQNHENTLRVSNLTKSVTEDDLRELFGRFGHIHRISLPRIEKTEQGKIIKEPRGFAYVAFHKHEDAESAMDRLQGYGYDHLILKLEWAKPPSKDPGSESGLGRGFVSGYGQKLAQDTKEQVSYASNLTGNR